MTGQLRSWVDSANDPQTDFPIQNLPFGVFRREEKERPTIGVAIGGSIVNLRAAATQGLLAQLPDGVVKACGAESLNRLMALGNHAASAVRQRLTVLLCAEKSAKHRGTVEPLLVPMNNAEMLLPAVIGDYTDFYASIYHASNVGSLFRPDNPLLPNYKYLPIGYHGRASSIVASGTEVRRPRGQTKAPDAATPVFGLSRSLDFELEVGFFVARENALGAAISIDDAEERIFGLCLLNDWSARDMQAWEYQPLGPFLAKSFATTISPWMVTMEALRPFRVPAFQRAASDPEPLPYLHSERDQALGGIDLTLEVWLSSRQMRERNCGLVRLCRSNARDLYWTLAQMLTHHASNGCNLRPGDLLGTGTISGPTRDSLGSLLELTRRGAEPLKLPMGEMRKFLEDGDEVTLRGYCEREGCVRIGFGECRGIIQSA